MKKIFTLLLVALCASCVQDNIESITVEQAQSAKIIRLSDNNVGGSMIIYFDEEATTRVEAGVTRSASTRSGIDQLDQVLDQIGAVRIERLFMPDKFEDKLRAEGMHRWYLVKFDADADLDKAAELFSSVAEVEKVQYNTLYTRIGENATSTPSAFDVPATRAKSTYPAFSDPDLGRQWHYINVGDTNVYSGIKAGADINVGEAWDITAGDPRVIVAIIDGMVKYDHPDLADNMWVNEAEKSGAVGVDDDGNGYVDDIYGVNFVTYIWDGTTTLIGKYSDHGTHVAGTVAAVNNNGKGVCGVAGGTGNGDGARLMSCQVFYQRVADSSYESRDWPSGSDACTAKAFQYATANGAAIAQCSYGFSTKWTADSTYSQGSAEKAAIDYFIKYGGGDVLRGGIPIFAAGNESSNYCSYPGAYRDYLSVTSMSCDFTPAYYTNFGPGSNIAAPGGDYLQKYYTDRTGQMDSEVYSTTFVDGQYGFKQGTSMACPHVSGVAALAISHALKLGKKLSSIDLRNILLGSTHDIDRYCVGTKTGVSGNGSATNIQLSNFKTKMGVGYIDAFKALMNVQGTPTLTVRVGVKEGKDLADVIGGNPTAMKDKEGNTTITVTISDRDRERIGLEGDITVSSTGKLGIKCTKIGSAVIKISFIAGGTELGSDEATGGMTVTREVAILSRGFATNGAWL